MIPKSMILKVKRKIRAPLLGTIKAKVTSHVCMPLISSIVNGLGDLDVIGFCIFKSMFFKVVNDGYITCCPDTTAFWSEVNVK